MNGQSLKAPYVIEISNTGTVALENVKLFKSLQNLNNPFYDRDGNLVIGDLKVISLTENIKSYQGILADIISKPCHIGLIFIESKGDNSQILVPFNIKRASNFFGIDIKPELDNSQPNENVVSVAQDFAFDGTTEIMISKINALTSVKYYFYPIE